MTMLRTPQDYADFAAKMKEAKEGYTLVKMPVGFHNTAMMTAIPNAWYGSQWQGGAAVHGSRADDRTRHRQLHGLRRSREERPSAMTSGWRWTAGQGGSSRTPSGLRARWNH